MFVSNPISQDSRVKREAAHLAKAGHEVTIIGAPGPGRPRTERWEGVRFVRIGPLGHRLVAAIRSLFGALSFTNRRPGAPPAAEKGAGASPPPLQPATGRLRMWPASFRLWLGVTRTALAWVSAGLLCRADVYHAHDLDTLLYAWLCARVARKRLVYDSHELYVEWTEARGGAPALVRWLKWVESRLAKTASLVITVSDGIADELQRLYGIPRPLVVRNCDESRPFERRRDLRDRIGGDAARPIILYQGGYTKNRGLEEAIRAAEDIPEADMVFLGPDSPYKVHLQDIAGRSPHRNVFLLTAVPADVLWQYTCGADIGLVLTQPFCLSYALSESNKLYQYMAAGLPVVASAIESHQRVAAETGAVALADPYNPQDIARTIKALLADPKQREKMGRQGQAWTERKYNATQEIGKLVAAYERLAQPTGSGKTDEGSPGKP